MDEFKVPGLPASAAAAAAAPSSSSHGASAEALPQDLAMILELMGPPSPGAGFVGGPKESAEEVIRQIEAGRAGPAAGEGSSQEVVVGKEDDEEGKVNSDDDDSDDSDSSSSSSSTSSSASSASRSVTGTAPSASIVASHARNAQAVSRLTREASAGAESEPELLDPDFFKSPNELPAPVAAPALPFDRIPAGQGARELGVVTSVVGKLMVIKHHTGGPGRSEEEILGEGTVVCWKDGRVLGVVHDTFGPLTAPMYTLILPEPFAPPTAPVEEDAPVAAEPSAAATERPTQNDIDAPTGEAVKELAQPLLVDEPGVVSESVRPAPGSPPRDDDLEVEALVLAEPVVPSPPIALDSPMPPSPLPSTSTLPASPPAPHRALPPAFPKAALVGLTVFYPVQSSNPVPVAQLKRQRWTDASNKFDEECGEDEMDWSDDEAEAAAKRRRKQSRGSKAGSIRGGSPTPSMHSQWGGSHFDANSDDEGTVLNYSAVTETSGLASLPKRPMPVAYDDLDAGEYRGESSSAANGGPAVRGGKKRERGGGPTTRGKGKERASDSPVSSRGGFESRGGGRGGGRGGSSGARGGFDAGRGIGRPRGRGGHAGSGPHNPHASFESQTQQQQQQQQQHQLPPTPAPTQPPSRPMSPTSMAIARATGQLPAAPPGAGLGQPSPNMSPHGFPARPYFPQQQPYPYPAPYGHPMSPYGQNPPPGQQPPQQQHAFGAPPPGVAGLPPFLPAPPFAYPGVYHGPQTPTPNPTALQQALQQQQAEHNKQLLEMQRQIALLSRKQASAAPTKTDGGGAAENAPQ